MCSGSSGAPFLPKELFGFLFVNVLQLKQKRSLWLVLLISKLVEETATIDREGSHR